MIYLPESVGVCLSAKYLMDPMMDFNEDFRVILDVDLQ